MASDEMNETRRRLHEAEGMQVYHLELFGDALAIREGYTQVDGIDAVRFYLMQKHNWTPPTVRSLSYEDLLFALQEEMSGWTIGASARKRS
jgi:hypothetical protein